MSMDRCSYCDAYVDTDFDDECYVGLTCICEHCREKQS